MVGPNQGSRSHVRVQTDEKLARTSNSEHYHWTPQRRGLRAQGPSIILCAKKRSFQVPQRRGSPHSGEGKNGKDRLITAKRRGYGKFPVVGIQDLYKTDLQNSFRVIRIILRGVPGVVTQILSLT